MSVRTGTATGRLFSSQCGVQHYSPLCLKIESNYELVRNGVLVQVPYSVSVRVRIQVLHDASASFTVMYWSHQRACSLLISEHVQVTVEDGFFPSSP